MKILVNQIGGFAGQISLASVDTANLNPGLVRKLKRQLQSLDFFSLPATVVGTENEIGADLLEYEINIDEGNRQHSVRFKDDNSPETASLREFVRELRQF